MFSIYNNKVMGKRELDLRQEKTKKCLLPIIFLSKYFAVIQKVLTFAPAFTATVVQGEMNREFFERLT